MHLASVEIKNFRSLKHVRLDFCSGLNVIVGRNNTGKTNLFHAIRHAIGPAGARGEGIRLDLDDFYRSSRGAEPETVIEITLVFSDLSDDQRAQFFEIVEFDLAEPSKSTAIIRFEASWPKGRRHPAIRRTGGPSTAEPPEVPTQILEALPITFLPALRDAEGSLAPGYRSRLALLLRELADRRSGNTKQEIEAIFEGANSQLEQHGLVSDVRTSLQKTTRRLAGTDYAPSAIKAADVSLDKILRQLQVQMDGAPIGSLDANGLGYNNLLYMAVVLEHLAPPSADECPLLLVEEPEAHLHPQLTALLAKYLAGENADTPIPQTIVTTHSPTLAAGVPPNRVHVVFEDRSSHQMRCNSIAKAGMTDVEERALQRMMDITRASLYFAKGAILVEGISEALLVPVLAQSMGHSLAELHISVIPICGVAFETFKKLLSASALGIPIALLTDGDPPVIRGESWRTDQVSLDASYSISDRTSKLLEVFRNHESVRVFHSIVTLEFDLADAGDDNAKIMAEVWESCFTGNPSTFNRQLVAEAGNDRRAKAFVAWRGICRADHSGSKAEFAHRLAAGLSDDSVEPSLKSRFGVPDHVRKAIESVVERVDAPPVPEEPAKQ
jgi:putative ATP-dependent endonuclease of OLD family